MLTTLKEAIEKKINTGNSIDINEFFNVEEHYDYISFDIFDTLLKRNVQNPLDIFRIIEMKLDEKYEGFFQNRILAERKARDLSTNEEITIEDIYENYNGINKTEQKNLIKFELQIEKNFLTINPDLSIIYQSCIKAEKTVFITSDMYLPIDFIKEILKENGIDGYKELYLSSDKMKTKSTGNLFDLLLREQSIKPKQLLHIGDSLKSDLRIPKSLGIQTFLIPRITRRSNYQISDVSSKVHVRCLNSFINNHIDTKKDPYYRFGYEKFGMFLWGYAKWLIKTTRQNNIDRLYFFSRDGLIMKKAVDICNLDNNIKTYYLEVSRRSLRIPVLGLDCEFETVLDMLTPSKMISIYAIFEGVGLDIKQYKGLLKKYSFTENTVFDRGDIKNNSNLRNMYDELKPSIVEVSQKEYRLLQKYIEQNELYGNIAIIDIGWSGGMQRFLDQTLTKMEIPHSLHGYYIGVAKYFKRNAEVVKSLDLNGYLFDFQHNKNDIDKRSSFVGLFETLFLEQGGSVKNYYINDEGTVSARRYPYEYIQNGKPTEEYTHVKNIQEGALQFIYDINSDDMIKEFNYKADELFSGIYQTGARPTKDDIKLFADFGFYDEGEKGKLAAPRSIGFYIFHFKEFKRDFFASRWKVGFMKRLFVINLPYEKLYKLLKKIM